MIEDPRLLPKQIREEPPCHGCTERFIACSDRCPKDERGEFGYKAWKAELARVKKARRHYAEFATNRGYKFRWEDHDE